MNGSHDTPESTDSQIDLGSAGSRGVGIYGDSGTDLYVEPTEGGLTEPLLLDWRRRNEDMRLVARAAKHRWPIPDKVKEDIQRRLHGIVQKTSVTIMSKHGEPIEVDLPADCNAIAASKVLVEMEGQNQEDDHVDKGKGIGGGSIYQQFNINGTDDLQAKAEAYGIADSRLKRMVERRTDANGNGSGNGNGNGNGHAGPHG